MRDLLFLCHRIPFPPNKGDKIRSWNIFRHLSGRYNLHLGCFIERPEEEAYESVVAERCGEHMIARIHQPFAKLRSLLEIPSGGPLTAGFYHSREMASWVESMLRRRRPDRIFIFSSAMAPYVVGQNGAGVRRIVDLVDVDSDKWRQYAAGKAWPARMVYAREARKLLELERRVAREFSATILISQHEVELLKRMAPESDGRIHAVPNGVDVDFFSPYRSYGNPFRPGTIPVVFVGAMDYWPNIDAAKWFAEKVLPKLNGLGSVMHFAIVGSNPTTEVTRLRGREITVTGSVADVRPYLAHAAAVVAPLRIARGVQNKILEAMAMGKAVVTTPQGLEGIEAEPDVHLRVAGDADAFVEAVRRVVRDEENRTIGSRGRMLVESRYGWAGSLAHIESILEGDRPSGLH